MAQATQTLAAGDKAPSFKIATDGGSRNAAKWIAKYGSVTFNQFGRENPTGGMNEMGLVVEQMWLDETEYPKDDARPTLGTQEWMEYLLDTSATTAEAVKNAEEALQLYVETAAKHGDPLPQEADAHSPVSLGIILRTPVAAARTAQ